ncbi:MAG: hypothetical protein F4Z35_05045 [Dehalococcoidia bacterium]|nr:hypothetical protein [Dehalococcoidia bacterium]
MAIRYAGIALMVGVVLAFVAPLFMPGYTFINPVDQTDFPAARDALGDSAVLAQWMTFLTLISLLLMSFGFLGLYPLASRQAGLGGRLLQFGIIATLIEWSILIIATGMRHFEIHLMQRSNMAADGSQSAAEFQAAALAVHIDTTAVTLAFVALAPIASSIFGLGLSWRFDSMDLFKVACYLLVASGLVGLVNYLSAMNAPDAGIQALLLVNTIVLYIQGVCLIIVGFGMYRGRDELAEES